MKVIVQIPALNEEETLATVIREIPRSMPFLIRHILVNSTAISALF